MESELPYLDFGHIYQSNDNCENDENSINSINSFDVYEAANSQRKPRRSSLGMSVYNKSTKHDSDNEELKTLKPFQSSQQKDFQSGKKRSTPSSLLQSSSAMKHAPKTPNTQFKAMPLNRKIFDSCGEFGVPKIQPRPLTEPQPFHLNTERRSSLRSQSISKSRPESVAKLPSSSKTNGNLLTLTVPKAPVLRTSLRLLAKPTAWSSEDLAMQRINEEMKAEQLRKEAAKQQYANYKRKSSFTPGNVSTQRSTKQLTVPRTPRSRLDQRLGKKQRLQYDASEAKGGTQYVDFNNNYNSSYNNNNNHHGHSSTSTLTLTLPEPFIFETEKRSRQHVSTIAKETFKPFGESVHEFHLDARSHYVPVNAAKQITEPKTPNLQTAKRARCDTRSKAHLKSQQDELDLEELEQHHQKRFKAKPVNRRVLDSTGDLGVPKVQPRRLTEPQPFHLSSSNSTRGSISCGAHQEAAGSSFKAMPMPSFHEGVKKTRTAAKRPALTIPKSPKLHGVRHSSEATARVRGQNHKATSSSSGGGKA